MKLRAIKFMQAVSLDGRMVERAEEGTASALGIVVHCPTPILVPWHMVRWAEVVEREEQPAVDLDKPWAMTINGVQNVGPTEAGAVSAFVETLATPKRKRGKP